MTLEAPSAFPTAPPRPCTVLVVDDHGVVRDGIVALLRAEAGGSFEICGTAGTGEEALSLAAKKRPHLIILDYFLDGGSHGAGLIREFVALKPPPRVLVLSLYREDDVGERALRAGARGILCKREGAARLFEAIAVVLNGGLYVTPRLQELLLDRYSAVELRDASVSLDDLTDRELQIYRLLGAGIKVNEIARKLGLSARTVSSHRENLKNKLRLQSAEQVAESAAAWLRKHIYKD